MKRIALLAFSALLTGCIPSLSSFGTLHQEMSAAQIKAAGKESNISCFEGSAYGVSVRSVFINTDKGVVENGNINIQQGCTTFFQNNKNAPVAPPIMMLQPGANGTLNAFPVVPFTTPGSIAPIPQR